MVETVVVQIDGVPLEVPRPRIRAAPRIERKRRHELATLWLLALSQHPTPQRVQELAPLVGRYPRNSLVGAIASELVASGQVPAPQQVEQIYLERRARAQLSRRRQLEQARDRLEAFGGIEAVLALVDQHRARYGTGPAWKVLREALGLRHSALTGLMHDLARQGVVTFSREPGSLRRAGDT